MLVIKAFAEYPQRFNNTVGVTNAVGELAARSRTFSTELGYYTSNIFPEINLVTFLAAKDNVKQPVDAELRDRIFTILKFINDTANLAGSGLAADQLLTKLISQFSATASAFQSGAIVNDGANYLPEWVSWVDTASGDNLIRIWFADASFQTEYDEYEIVVIPPITPVDSFFKYGQEVEKLVNAVTPTTLLDQIQAVRELYPETIQRTDPYMYYDQLNTSHKFNCYWAVLIYGPAGNNIDAIREALSTYILANSVHTRDDWMKLFPDIFKRTEIVIVPRYDLYAIPDRQLTAGIYSPLQDIKACLTTLAPYTKNYPTDHVANYAQSFGHMYKSLAMLAVGSPENRDNKYRLSDWFPDYITVSTTSQDFNRMGEDTRGFAMKLAEMVQLAERMTQYSTLPMGYTRSIRDGKLFIVATYANVHFLVAAKSNFQ